MKLIRRLICFCLTTLLFSVPRAAVGGEFDLGVEIEKAGKGEAESQYAVGRAYFRGEGASKDLVKAAEFFRKAADQSHRKAQANLGSMYIQGRGVAADPNEAMRLFKEAAKANDPVALTNLGWMYASGQATEKNMEEALGYYRRHSL